MSVKESPQVAFFKHLKENTEGRLVDTIAKLLEISPSGAYSKMNGTNGLSYNELILIAKHFNVSVDYFVFDQIEDKTPYAFYSDSLKFPHSSFSNYLENSLNHLIKIGQIPGVHLTYLTSEIPLPYIMQHNYLAAFKMYVWNATNWMIPQKSDEGVIELLTNSKDIFKLRNKFALTYCQYETTEIWNYNMFNQTYRQLIYFIQIGKITGHVIPTKILEEIKELIDTLEQIATSGLNKFTFKKESKESGSTIYLNEIMNTHEIIYASSSTFRIHYSHFDAPNFVRSFDDRVCNHTELIIDRQKKFSSLLSSPHAQSERLKFFTRLRNELQLFTRIIQTQLESNQNH
ncbi:MAG: helix-turn-helix transcriptional regulator [Saprospiraceae bacterium]